MIDTRWSKSPESAYRFTGLYGRDWRQGILTVDVAKAEAAGYRIHTSASGQTQWLVCEDGVTFPVVCEDLIEVTDSEGFRNSGRCGIAVAAGHEACEAHEAERAEWRAMTEAERLAWERRQEEDSWL